MPNTRKHYTRLIKLKLILVTSSQVAKRVKVISKHEAKSDIDTYIKQLIHKQQINIKENDDKHETNK